MQANKRKLSEREKKRLEYTIKIECVSKRCETNGKHLLESMTMLQKPFFSVNKYKKKIMNKIRATKHENCQELHAQRQMGKKRIAVEVDMASRNDEKMNLLCSCEF